MPGQFHKFSIAIADRVGSPWTFAAAMAVVVAWAVTGPMFGYSDTWQLVINTGTSVITFLMVFLIQNTQNRDTKVIQLKIDELLCAIHGARTEMVNLDKLSDEDLMRLAKEFEQLGKKHPAGAPPVVAPGPAPQRTVDAAADDRADATRQEEEARAV